MTELTPADVGRGWDPDPASSMSLHADAHTRERWFDVDQRQIIGRSWQWMCHGGEGGLTRYCERYTDSFNRWWDDLGEIHLDTGVAAELVEGVSAEAGPRTTGELSAERDALLAAILLATSEHRSTA